MSAEPAQPVLPWSLDLADKGPWAGLELRHVSDLELARLVRFRLGLSGSHGWVLLGCIGVALAVVVAVGLVLESQLVFGACAAAMATCTVGMGFVSERLCNAAFARRGQAVGLSALACEQAFEAAGDAEHWLRVMASCGQEVTDQEVAAFVRHRTGLS
jgi:hypothetical protein